ncbi:MAG: permease, partial [Pseudoxanthomonas sp.]
MKTLKMAWRQLLRDAAAGDIRILFAALVLAVVAVTAVGFVTDRAERALAIEANRLLGGDVVVRGDAPITGIVRDAANATGLRRTETLSLDSMIRAGEELRLGDLRALGEGFPLRGSFRIIDSNGAAEQEAKGVPARGTLWLSQSGAETLDAKIGDSIGIGDSQLRLAALVTQ